MLVDGDWKDEPKAKASIEKERNRELTLEERAQYIESWQRVFEYMQERGASSEEFARVKELSERLIQELKGNN